MRSFAQRLFVTTGDLTAHAVAAGVAGAVLFNAITLLRLVTRGGQADAITWEFVGVVSTIGAVLCGGYAAAFRARELWCRGRAGDLLRTMPAEDNPCTQRPASA